MTILNAPSGACVGKEWLAVLQRVKTGISWQQFEEDDPQLLSYKDACGVPWWLQTRHHVLDSLKYILDCNLSYDLTARARSTSLSSFKYLRSAMSKSCPSVLQDNSLNVVFHTDTTRYYCDEKGVARNIYSDYFMECRSGSSAVMEKAPVDWSWETRRRRDNVYDYTPEFVAFRVLAKLQSHSLPRSYIDFMNYVEDKARQMLGEIDETKWLRGEIVTAYVHALADRHYSEWLLGKLGENVKLMIMLGSIFSRSYYITRRLKESGVRVAEIQHGIFPEGRSVLFSPSDMVLNQEDYLLGLPDDYLSYGNLWSERLELPINKISIGSPYRDMRLEKQTRCDKNKIVVMGCLHNTIDHIELVRSLKSRLPQETVLFRPHPNEVNNALKLLDGDSALIDSDDLYNTLAHSKAVICEYSTSMFEALGLSNLVIAWRTEYSEFVMPNSPFVGARTVDEIVGLLEKGNSGIDHYGIEENAWSTGWRNRFEAYLSSVGV